MADAKFISPSPVTNNVIVFHKNGKEIRYAYRQGEYGFHIPRKGEVVYVDYTLADGTKVSINGLVDRVEASFFSTEGTMSSVTCGVDVYLS